MGRPRKIESPEQMEKLWEEYKEYCDNRDANAYVKSPSVDWMTGEKNVLMDALDKYVFNRDKRNATLKGFEDKGVTSEQSDLLNEYYKRLTREQSIQNMSNFADNHEVLGTLASFPTKLAGNIHSTIGNTGAYLLGEPIDSDSVWNMAGNTTDAMRESASKDLGNVGQFAYNIGTSIGDVVPTLATSVATGRASAVPMLVSGVSVYGDSTREGADRGLNPKQIMATGTANVAIEAAFEKIPLEGLTNIATKSGKTATKSLVKELAEQMGREAFEEMGTETVNNIADVIINGDKSNFNLSKQAYMSMGMSEEEATRQAYADIAKNVAYSGAAGAVSGGIMGAGASAFSRFSGNNSVQTNPKNALGLQDNTAEQSTSPVEVAESQQATNVGKTVNGDNTQIELLDGVHTVEQLITMEEYKRSSNSQIGVWAERKRSGQKAYKYLPVATVNDTVADLVMQKYGLDIHGNSIGLNNSSLNHIDKEHINNNSKSPLGNEDLERIGYVLENPDEVALTDETTTATRTKDNHFAPKIVVRKRIDGHYYIVEAVTDATTGQDVVVTAFIEEVGKESSEYKELFKGAYHVPSALDNSSPLAHVRNVHENNSSNESISNLRKAVNKAEYSTKKIDGFDELNKALDRLVGMYKGNENTQNLYSQMKAAVNEYVQTGNQDAIDMAVTLASDIDDTLVGHSYTRKGSGKNSAKSQNNRVTTTFSKGEFADTFMSYSKSLWDAARNRSNNTNDNVAHDSDVVERIASMREDGNQRKRSYNDTLINKTDAPQELKNELRLYLLLLCLLKY